MNKNLLVLLTCLCLGLIAQAMPAKPGWHTVRQSDGTTLKVRAVGNAFNSALLTSDGLAVARGEDGDFYYISSVTGLTTVRAHEVEQRTSSENAFINVQRGSLTMPNNPYRMPRKNGMLGVGGSNEDSSVPALGHRRIPIILVEFKDKKFNNTPQKIIDAMLTGNESVGQYFRDQSNGVYQPDFEVFGIYELSQNREYYGDHQGSNNDRGLGYLVTEACQLAAADGVTFKPYDTNSDDYCDVVIVMYAGVGEAQASRNHPEAVWPCHWNLSSAFYYGMGGSGAFRPNNGDPFVNDFAVFNELHGDDDNASIIDGIGTFVHEFGHCLGLPDFYDTGNGDYYGLGYWDVMCMGCYNNDGYTPPGYSAYEKVFMGWLDYVTPEPGTYYTLPVWNQKNAATDQALCIKSDINPNEYFILENRRKQGWDRYINGEGIMITHVTYNKSRWRSNTPNNENIQLMTLMNADNSWSYYTEVTDLWPQGNKNAFTDNSTPAAKLNMTANGGITGNAGYLGKGVTDMVINRDGTASFWYMREAVTEPQLIVVEDTIDFGDVMLGTTKIRTFKVMGNHLTSDVDITMQDNAAFSYSPSSVGADDTYDGYEVTVSFSPTWLGESQTIVYVNSEGAERASVVIKGRGVVLSSTPVMQPANSAFIGLTQFRADWTDSTPAENVTSYTLEVEAKPAYTLLEIADFSTVPNALTDDGSSFVNIADDYEAFLPEGWWAATYLSAYKNALLLGRQGTINSPIYGFTSYDKVTVVVRVASYYYDTSSIKIMTSQGEQILTLDKTYADHTVVLDCADLDAVTIKALENYTSIRQVEIYAGDMTATLRDVSESGDAVYRLITDITDKFYTVEGLEAEGTYIYKVKSVFSDGTESDWSNVEEVTLFENVHGFDLGDVDKNGAVNISDVTALVDYLLNGDASSISLTNADCNGNGAVNIADVVELIDYLLAGHWPEPEPTPVITTFTANGVTFDMVEVEGGTFMMGGTPEQGDEVREREKPVHQVTLSSYNIGQTEVTQELWHAVMGENPSYHTGDLQRPVERVSWVDCQEFISKLNQLTGKSFRLPTEAEWEYAARGGNKSKGYRYAGGNDMNEVSWYIDNSENTTHPVATKTPNELCLYDMTGNVWEWTNDWFKLYTADSQVNPTGPATGNNRVLRGGCWNGDASYNRIAYRDNFTPTGNNSSGGLRLVLDVDNNSKFSLSETVVNLQVGWTNSVFILNGGGNYTVAGGTDYATASINGNKLIVTGTALGTTTVCVTDAATGATAVLTVIVTESTLHEEEFTVNGVTFKMITIDGGTFTMGATEEQGSEYYGNERPTHQVRLSSYKIGQTEVTQKLWQAVMGSNPSNCTGDLQRPVEKVSWNDCQTFITRLNQLTGKSFRLPTEAEWEFASRGGNLSQGYKFAGSNTLDDVAWFYDNSDNTTHPVGTKTANELGLYDMSGNVFEWCQDWFGDYSGVAQTNPTGPATGTYRVVRGGAWNYSAKYCRLSYRSYHSMTSTYDRIGLRLALD